MYGKFGTDRRLDFTVIGVTVNQTIRMEGLCKALDTPLVISENFQSFYVEETVLLGADTLAGLDKGMSVFTVRNQANSLRIIQRGPTSQAHRRAGGGRRQRAARPCHHPLKWRRLPPPAKSCWATIPPYGRVWRARRPSLLECGPPG